MIFGGLHGSLDSKIITIMNTTPNIILIMADNHPAKLLGSYGNHEIHTPNLDKLAANSAQFNQAYCVNAMCSPCRASVLTGQMPSHHGVHTWIDDRRMETWPENWNALAEYETLPELLKANGYDTAMIGKYHLGSPLQAQNGFDHWVTFPHGHTRDFWGNTVIENGEQDTYDGHIVDYFADKATDYLSAAQRQDNPFFLFLPFNAPYGHWPSIQNPPRNRFAELYADCKFETIPREGLNKAVIDRYVLRLHESGGGLDYSAVLRIPNDVTSLWNYFSQMSMLDDAVGKVMSGLDAAGLTENTLVVYTCDHGFSLGHHGCWGHGQVTWPSNAYASSYHIPMLISHPSIATGERDQLTSQVDLFPTLLKAAGIKAPETAGRDLTPLLSGKPVEAWEDIVYIEQEETRAIRTSRWLYVKRFKGNERFAFGDELFDLEKDPDERNNLIADETHAAIITILEGKLTRFFDAHTQEQFDPWRGGVAKSNSDKPWYWQEVWGEDWQPVF